MVSLADREEQRDQKISIALQRSSLVCMCHAMALYATGLPQEQKLLLEPHPCNKQQMKNDEESIFSSSPMVKQSPKKSKIIMGVKV
mmetsp:Transcript_2351/g.3583  ORF Transcript_2351/g.3583 Transcript_2351/m.3583 type:complete len:86 (-) Transcript_2351:205-462(-)